MSNDSFGPDMSFLDKKLKIGRSAHRSWTRCLDKQSTLAQVPNSCCFVTPTATPEDPDSFRRHDSRVEPPRRKSWFLQHVTTSIQRFHTGECRSTHHCADVESTNNQLGRLVLKFEGGGSAQNHTRTGRFPRLRRLRRKEFPVVLDVDKSPCGQQSEICGGKSCYQL